MGAMDVFGLGACVVDRIGIVDAFPEADAKCEAEDWRIECGGPVATALVALSRWGRTCGFGGVVGEDAEGALIRADFEAESIDTQHLQVRPGAASQQAFIAVERASGCRKIYWRRPTGAAPELACPECRLFLTDGLFADISARLARDAAMTVVDAGTLRDGTRELLPVAEVVVASESFARAYVGADDPEGCCRKLQEEGVRIAGVTLGDRGYVALIDGEFLRKPAREVHAIDTTGCGDLFHAGICEGILAGWDWRRTVVFAKWAAGAAATAIGGRAGIPPR
jgi:sulfofructose kinase